MARTLIVSRLHISERVATKLRDVHDLEAEDVRAQIEGVGRLPFSWDNCPNRGLRALVWTAVDDDAVLAVLYPARSGSAEEWHLGSAYRDDPPS
jgi:hypothetical protein